MNLKESSKEEVNMAFDPISAGIDAAMAVIKRIWPEPMTKEKEAEVQQSLEGTFRNFVIEYEGAAKDVPKPILYLRSLIRPVFTVMVGYIDYMYFIAITGSWAPEKVALLKAINIIVLFFWFGERAVTNSGIIDLLRKK